MSENNTAALPIAGSFHASLRETLDHMAEQGYIGWDKDYDSRRDAFFAALASEDDHTSTIEGALVATFGDLDNQLLDVAQNIFNRTYILGASAPIDSKKPKKTSKFGDSVRRTLDAIKN